MYISIKYINFFVLNMLLIHITLKTLQQFCYMRDTGRQEGALQIAAIYIMQKQ